MKHIEPSELKARLRKGEPIASTHKEFVAPVQQISDRQIKFTISTPNEDRDSDVIMQDGWDLSNYLQNPVVLLNHKYDECPIAKCVWIGLEDGNLKAVVEFVPASVPLVGEIAESVYQLCQGGFLSATSVGFQAIEWDWRSEDDGSDGMLFIRQELLEFSICSVPSNPQALIERPSPFALSDHAPEQAVILNNRNQNVMRQRLILAARRLG